MYVALSSPGARWSRAKGEGASAAPKLPAPRLFAVFLPICGDVCQDFLASVAAGVHSWHMTTRGKKNERGATAVEYGLIVAGIAAAIIIPMQVFNIGLTAAFPQHVAAGECGTVAPPPGGCPTP